ncbi:MAG TPA: ABC transporter permease [Coriobacteriia bacterium]|nr:ABC transporter permease [Coriobacteriia bacterium]
MKKVLAIARLNLLELMRDRTELVSVIVLPLLLTWVFGTAFGSQGVERPLAIPVADLDSSAYSKAIVQEIADAKSFDVESATEPNARQMVRDGDSPIAIVIPEGFGSRLEAGRTSTIETVRYPASQNAQAAAQVVEGAAARVSANVAAANVVVEQFSQGAPAGKFARAYATADALWEPRPPVAVKLTVATASSNRSAELEAPANTQYSLGFTVFFVFMTALGSAGGVLEDRELGTLRRVLSAPVRRAELLGGKVLGVAIVSAFEAAILVGFGTLVFGVPWGTEPLAVTAVLLSLVLAATGLGVMVSALVRTRSQMSAVAPILSTGLAMLGGCYWPVEITSPLMQTIAKFTPTGWAMVGLKDAVARGMGVEGVLVPVAVLLSFSAITLFIGVTRLRLE